MQNLLGEFLSFFQQFHLALYPKLLLASGLGTVLGIIWGAMPALSTTMAMALLIGFSSVMDLHTAVMFLVAVYMGSTSGGSISAIFVNIPGTPAAICTAMEGFPLAKKGKGGMALGAAIIASAIGNFFGILFLVFFFPLVIALAMKFGAWEIFLPGVAVGSLYKYEIRTRSGELLVKSDPYAFESELRVPLMLRGPGLESQPRRPTDRPRSGPPFGEGLR